MLSTRARERRPLIAVLYGVTIAFNAGLISFLGVAALGTWVGGEKALGYGIIWVFSLPWILIAGILGWLTFPLFQRQATWLGTSIVYAATVVGAIMLGVGGAYLFAWVLK